MSSFFGCASSILKQVDSAEEPVLKFVIARDMITQMRYGLALKILQKIKEEYPNDGAIQIEADYEIAFISFTRKKYEQAEKEFETIITHYDSLENKNALPQWPYYLSKSLLENSIYPETKKDLEV